MTPHRRTVLRGQALPSWRTLLLILIVSGIAVDWVLLLTGVGRPLTGWGMGVMVIAQCVAIGVVAHTRKTRN